MSQMIKATASLAKKVQQLADLKVQIKELESQAKALDLEVRDSLGENFGSVVYKDLVIAVWAQRSTSRIDTKALEAKHPAIVAKFKTEAKSTVLTLK